MENSNKSAFSYGFANEQDYHHEQGLTKREYFAGLAMQGLCANYLRENVTGWNISTYAKEAVAIADELIKQLESK